MHMQASEAIMLTLSIAMKDGKWKTFLIAGGKNTILNTFTAGKGLKQSIIHGEKRISFENLTEKKHDFDIRFPEAD